jgi:multisubunit Na+/H+ antiporter MnhB subunit
MRFWWRELSGWLLIALSLIAFVLVYDFCERRRMTEAWPLTIVGLVIFWGGIQLLKVAIAARICQQAQDRVYPANPDFLPQRSQRVQRQR